MKILSPLKTRFFSSLTKKTHSKTNPSETTEFFTLDDIAISENNDEDLYCLTVDSPHSQFQIGTLGVPTHNSDEAKEASALKDEARQLIGSILRLGRAAGVHMVVATQRPDAKMLPGEMKANMPVRVVAGSVDPTASDMILSGGEASREGTRVKSNPRGRIFVLSHQLGRHAQGFFANGSFIDKWLEERRAKGLYNGASEVQAKIEANNESEMTLEEDDNSGSIDIDAPHNNVESAIPGLGKGSSRNDDKFHHEEDDWDDFMDDIVVENKEKS